MASTISWSNAGGGDWTTASDWTPAVVPGAGDDAFITVPGSYTVTIDGGEDESAQSVTLDDSDATLEVNGTLNLGGTLGLDSGTLDLSGGTIDGGTIIANGGAFDPTTASLVGVTYLGTLDLSGVNSAFLNIYDGITLENLSGSQPGEIKLTGYQDSLNTDDSTTLNNATIDIGNYSTLSNNDTTGSGQTLTLGANLDLVQAGNAFLYTSDGSDDVVVNQGSISTGADAGFVISGNSFDNQGSITVSNGSSVDIDTSDFDNTGSITVASGILEIDGTINGLGSITLDSGTTLDLQGSLTAAQLATVTNDGGTIEISGTLNNAGSTLDIGAGSSIGTLDLDYGTIVGGVIHDAGSGLTGTNGVLNSVTYRGTLDLAEFVGTNLFIQNNITLESLSGSEPGQVNLTGNELGAENSMMLNNATIDIGGFSSLGNEVTAGTGNTLTLGPNLSLVQTGYAYFDIGYGSGSAINQGSISAGAGAGIWLDIDGSSFTNQGSITVSNDAWVWISTTAFSNTGSITVASGTLMIDGTLTGSGSIIVDSGSTLDLEGRLTTTDLATVTNDSGTIEIGGTLNNAGSTLDIGPGSAIGTLDPYYGTIVGGTIHDSGSGLNSNSGHLSGVTYEGTLDLSGLSSANLFIDNSMTLESLSGSLPGQINLTGTNDSLFIDNSMTLNNAAIYIGNSGTLDYDYLWNNDTTASGQTLTLGPDLNLAGSNAIISAGSYVGDIVVNQGSIGVTGYFSISGNSFDNSGSISTSSDGVLAVSTGTFTNAGTVTATSGAVTVGLTTSVINTGLLNAAGGLIQITGPLSNLSGAMLSGGSFAAGINGALQIYSTTPITTDNSNIILAGANAVIETYNLDTSTNTLLDTSLATIAASGTLQLQAGRNFATPLTDNGLILLAGGTLSDTPTIGASGTLGGFGTLAAMATDTGKIEAQSGNLLLQDAITGTGSLVIDPGATLELAAPTAIGSSFTAGTLSAGTLKIDTASSYTGTIAGFAAADTIDLANLIIASASINAGDTLIADISGGGTQTYALTGSYAGDTIRVESDGVSGSNLALEAPCYAEGTHIRTPQGDVAVEALRTGNLVLTAGGLPRPVTWIGRRRIEIARHPSPDYVRPIRIAPGAFGPGMPTRALRLSPDHAVLLEGCLVPIRLLVNGASIVRESGCPAVTYFHVELDSHDILLAEALPAESYLDTGNRAMFGGPGMRLHADVTNDQARREAESCRPFLDDPVRAQVLWQTLAERAGVVAGETTDDPDLRVVVSRRVFVPARNGSRHVFALPGGGTARLQSRAASPCDTRPWIEDRRCLGVMVQRITVRQGATSRIIPLDHPKLTDGWWRPEGRGASHWRWTDGNAALALPDEPLTLEITLGEAMVYPVERRAA